MPKAAYDKQGCKFHSLVKQAGWDINRANQLLVKKFGATHWNALLPHERPAAISTMRYYAKKNGDAVKNRENVLKKIRQAIVAKVRKHGHSVDWLHEMMEAWGFGDSLRKLSMPELIECGKAVSKALEPEKNNKPQRKAEKSRGSDEQ